MPADVPPDSVPTEAEVVLSGHPEAVPSPVTGLQSAPSCWTTLCQDRVAHILLAVGPDLYLLDQSACSAVVRAQGAREMKVAREAVGKL